MGIIWVLLFKALLEIESAKTDIRTTLRELYITGAKVSLCVHADVLDVTIKGS